MAEAQSLHPAVQHANAATTNNAFTSNVAPLGWASDSTWPLSAGSAANWLRNNRRFIENERYAAGTVYMGLGLATAFTGARHK